MPEIGDKDRAKRLGYNHNRLMIWQKCIDCGLERWVETRNQKPVSGPRCQKCAASHWQRDNPEAHPSRELHPRWKGGIHSETNGYRSIVVPLDSPYIVMADSRGRVYEHRLVMAESVGRPLTSKEEVHHINGDKHDNRIENLIVKSKNGHMKEHYEEIHLLRKEVHRLREKLRKANIT